MENSERFTTTPEQLPKVTPEALAAFEQQPHDFKKDFTTLLRENPALARAITVNIEEGNGQLDHKVAFAKGALWMYTIVREALEAQRLAELFKGFELSDDGDDEDQPLSA